MHEPTNDYETCPTGLAASELPPTSEALLSETTLVISFETLVLLSMNFDLDVTDDLGPWSVHRVPALDVSACSNEMDPLVNPDNRAMFDSIFGLLGSRAVVSARAIVSQGDGVDIRTMATAIKVLALDHIGELPGALEAASIADDKFLTDRYSGWA